MATIELVANAADWIDNSSSTPLPAGKWSVSGNKLVGAGIVVPSWVYDYGPSRLQFDRASLGSVFYNGGSPMSAFMQKTSGHFVLAVTVTSCSASLVDAGIFHLVEASGYSGSAAQTPVVALSGTSCVCGTELDPVFFSGAGLQPLSGFGLVPWHMPTNQPLAAYLGVDVTFSVEVLAYWTDTLVVIPPFWTSLSGQREI